MEHYLLFSGHLIDRPERVQKRFPKEKEQAVRLKINEYLSKLKEDTTDKLFGIAGGACGGDILFHEICIKLSISSKIYLGLPPVEFKKTSVSFAGEEWDKRFDNLLKILPYQVMTEADYKNKNIPLWERANLWMLNDSLKNGGENMNLLALWDGMEGDGKGGTKHMVDIAKQKGAEVKIIEIMDI
jgi:hypothetical protein